MSKDEALKMAIEFMETLTIDVGIKTWNEKHRKEAIQACKEALEQPAQGMKAVSYSKDNKWIDMVEQPAQEPVAWLQEYENQDGDIKHTVTDERIGINDIPVYTHPAPSWQELSHDEIGNCFDEVMIVDEISSEFTPINFARAIEQALRNKNE